MGQQEDISYAVNTTRVVYAPQKTLETFGTTQIRYHLLSELMDQVNKVRIRVGVVYSERPQIITPQHYASQILEGFGDKAREYADWLMANGDMVRILKYGLQFRRAEVREEIVSETIANVADKVTGEVAKQSDDGLAAVVIGADELWEVSLLKFAFDYIQQSAPTNIQEIQQRGSPAEMEIENMFREATFDRGKVRALGEKLQSYGLFEKYEDRFYALLQ